MKRSNLVVLPLLALVVCLAFPASSCSSLTTSSYSPGVPNFINVGSTYKFEAYTDQYKVEQMLQDRWIKVTDVQHPTTPTYINMRTVSIVEQIIPQSQRLFHMTHFADCGCT